MIREINSLKKTIWNLHHLTSSGPDVSEDALKVNKEVFTKAKRVRKKLFSEILSGKLSSLATPYTTMLNNS